MTFMFSYSFYSSLCNLDIGAIGFYDRASNFVMHHFLQGVVLNMLFVLIFTHYHISHCYKI